MTDQDVVVAALMDRVALAFEHAERLLQHRRAELARATSRWRRTGLRARVEKRIEAGCWPVWSTLTAKCSAAISAGGAGRLPGGR